MSEANTDFGGFEHGAGFVAGEVAGTLGLGPLELQYEELFAEALADGVITAEERARLEKAADNLGLDRTRLLRLERAMLSAYQARHNVQIVEHSDEPVSLSPLRVQAEGDAGRALLLKRVEKLEARVRELEEELVRARAALKVEVDLTDLETSVADASEDPEDAWRRVKNAPFSADGYRQLLRIHAARSNADGVFVTAEALSVLGLANEAERGLFEASKQSTLIAPRGSVSQAAFIDLLFHPDQEPLTSHIFGLIAPAVLVGRVTALRRDGKLYQPRPETKQDPSKATLTAVRALPWGAAILGLACPTIYLDKERDVGFEHVPLVPPCTVIGSRALRGKSQLEQAFAVGRHLAWYRQELYLKQLFGAITELEDLFLAALTIGSPGLPIADDIKRRVAPVAQAIEPLLDASQLDALRGCFLRFVEEGGRTNLQRWSAATEKTAARSGLMLSGDLTTAITVLAAEEGPKGPLASDLLVFSVSERCSKLRKQLGVARNAS